MRINIYLHSVKNGVHFAIEIPEHNDVPLPELCSAKLLLNGFEAMFEEATRQIAAAGLSGFTGILPGSLGRKAYEQTGGPATPALIVNFVHREDVTLYTCMYPPRPDDDPQKVALIWQWIKGTLDFITDELRDGNPYDNPFAFEAELHRKLAEFFKSLPPIKE